jgi:crotonobetainyl-CoA:carnitine CoA-transferase CaiB-like acyl-CoA transferase
MLALEGIKILDMSGLAPGALCTMILGDLGAEVIKVESTVPSPLAGGGPSPRGEERRKEAAYFALNRNKKSVALNLKTDGGRQVFFQLAQRADIIVEGYRPGVVKRLGVDYDTIKAINPAIIYCSLSGYGQDGPYAQFPGHDINYISVGGALGLIGPRDGPPVIPLNLVGDFAGAALYGVIGILAALVARNKTGKGQFVDIAYIDGVVSLMGFFAADYFRTGIVPKRGESPINGAFPYYGVYQTKDGGYISIGCVEPHFWGNLCRFLGKEEYIPYNVAYSLMRPYDEKWQEISSYLKQVFLTRTRDEWFNVLVQKDIPVAKVYNLDEVFSDPQVLHRQMLIEIEHPTLGKIKQVGVAPKLSQTPGKVRSLSPLLGEHTREILQGLGYSQQEIERLQEEGAVALG